MATFKITADMRTEFARLCRLEPRLGELAKEARAICRRRPDPFCAGRVVRLRLLVRPRVQGANADPRRPR